MQEMRPRNALAALLLVAACGEAAPPQNFVPVADQVTVEDTDPTTTATTNPQHQIDPTTQPLRTAVRRAPALRLEPDAWCLVPVSLWITPQTFGNPVSPEE